MEMMMTTAQIELRAAPLVIKPRYYLYARKSTEQDEKRFSLTLPQNKYLTDFSHLQ